MDIVVKDFRSYSNSSGSAMVLPSLTADSVPIRRTKQKLLKTLLADFQEVTTSNGSLRHRP
jgi:hypothetical protein